MDPYDSSQHSLNKKFMMESQNDELEEGPLSDLSEIAIDSKEKGNYNKCLFNEKQLELIVNQISRFLFIKIISFLSRSCISNSKNYRT